MSIKPLPGDVVAQIKSSVVITSLNNVICGFIRNSLDAEATKINVAVDYSRGNCSAEDNGIGIPPSEFQEDGGLGQLHCRCLVLLITSPNLHANVTDGWLDKTLPISHHNMISTANMACFWPLLHLCHWLPLPRTIGTSTLTIP